MILDIRRGHHQQIRELSCSLLGHISRPRLRRRRRRRRRALRNGAAGSPSCGSIASSSVRASTNASNADTGSRGREEATATNSLWRTLERSLFSITRIPETGLPTYLDRTVLRDLRPDLSGVVSYLINALVTSLIALITFATRATTITDGRY